MLPKIGKSMTLSQHAYIVIKEAILNNKIKPKEILSEESLASTLGISRTPLRTALKKLEFEKLIFINSSKNAVVADIKKEDMESIFVVRISLEPVAAKIACTKMTEKKLSKLENAINDQRAALKSNDFVDFINKEREFNTLIARYTENEILSDALDRINTYMQRFLTLSMEIPKYANIALLEHQMIIDALKSKEPDSAAEKMLYHIKNVAKRLDLHLDI